MPGKTEKDSGEQGILRSDQMDSKEKDADRIFLRCSRKYVPKCSVIIIRGVFYG